MTGAFGSVAFDALVSHGPMLFAGVSIILAAGLLWTRAQRGAAARRRIGIGTAIASGLYLTIAALPLPRLQPTVTVALPPDIDATATPAILPPDVTPAEVLAALGRNDRAEAPAAAIDHAMSVSFIDSAPARRSPPAAVATIDWPSAIAMLYLGSIGLLLIHHLLGVLRLRSIVRRSRPASAATRALVALPQFTRVLFAHRPLRPFCAGYRRPVIVLSPELAQRPAVLAAVLRHEAAHLRARDPLVQVLFAVLALPLVLHPLFWWLRADVRFQSELLADQRAAGDRRTDYARELLHLVDCPAPRLAAAGTIAVFHRPSAFYRRIQMLLQANQVPSRPLSRLRRTGQLTAMLALVATTAGVFGVPAAAQDPVRARNALEAESQALRAQIAEMRRQIADLSAELQRNAERLPINPLTGLSGSGRPATQPPTRLSDAVRGRLDPATGRFTALPPGEEKISESPLPLPSASITRVPEQPAGLPFVPDMPVLGTLFRQPTGDGDQLRLEGTVPAPSAFHTPGMASTAEGTVELTSRLLDLETEIEIAKAKMEHTAALAKSGMVSDGELHAEEARLKNLMRKRDIVRGLVDGEIKATESEVAWLSQRMKRAKKNTGEHFQIEAQMQRAEGRLQALRAAR